MVYIYIDYNIYTIIRIINNWNKLKKQFIINSPMTTKLIKIFLKLVNDDLLQEPIHYPAWLKTQSSFVIINLIYLCLYYKIYF